MQNVSIDRVEPYLGFVLIDLWEPRDGGMGSSFPLFCNSYVIADAEL
jgi:hypothetical protein